MIVVLLDVALLLFIFGSLNFTLSIFLKRNDVADIGWGLGFIIVCLYCLLNLPLSSITWTVCSLVTLWGLRLSIYLIFRNRKKGEDFRYNNWRQEWGRSFYWRSFLQVFMLQMVILLIISLPIIYTGVYSSGLPLNTIQKASITLWIFGFLWQAIADHQLYMFKKNHPGEIMTSGLWKYSRHPNYFGEIVMWWSIFFMVMSIENGYYTIISPMLITYLLVKVSGVPMLESKYADNLDYLAYARSTPAVFPIRLR